MMEKFSNQSPKIPLEKSGKYNYQVLRQSLFEKTSDIEKFNNTLACGVCKIVFNQACTLLYANEYFFKMFGYTREDVSAVNYRTVQYIYEEDLPWVVRQTQEKLKTGKPYTLEYRIKHKNGSLVWVKLNSILSEEVYQGNTPVLYCIYTDITELKTIQQALHEKTVLLETFNETVINGIAKIAYDEAHTLYYGNEGYFRMLGYTRDQYEMILHNRTIAAIYPPDLPGFQESLREQLQKGNSFVYTFRLVCRNGTLVWFKIDGSLSEEIYNDVPVYYCIYTDISELKQAYEQIALDKERYRILTELTEGITFEYDLSSDTMYFSDRYYQYFKHNHIISKFKEHVTAENFAGKNDYLNYLNAYRSLACGSRKFSTELRIKLPDGVVLWFSVQMCNIFDDHGNAVKAIGKLVNIHDQKLAQQELLKSSQLDPMTKLYNKVSAENQITAYLPEVSETMFGAMLVIDIDNFKQVNDRKGHFVGDQVIQCIADKLRDTFRSTDILGRFGGDEFIVFIKNIYSEKIVFEKTARLCAAVREAYDLGVDAFTVSLSIGIAFASDSAITYQQLFKRADQALYLAKSNGKNRFEVYDCALETFQNPSFSPSRYGAEDKYTYKSLLDSVLDTLSAPLDNQAALHKILDDLVQSLQVCRAHISLFSTDGTAICPIAQAMLKSIVPPLPLKIAGGREDFLKNVNHDGFFLYHMDKDSNLIQLEDPKEITVQSFLGCLIKNGRQAVGYIGLSYCNCDHKWAQVELDILQSIAKAITGKVLFLAEEINHR